MRITEAVHSVEREQLLVLLGEEPVLRADEPHFERPSSLVRLLEPEFLAHNSEPLEIGQDVLLQHGGPAATSPVVREGEILGEKPLRACQEKNDHERRS